MRTEIEQPTADLLSDLHQLPLFSGFAKEQLTCFATAETVDAEAGTVLLEQGEQTASFWIVLSGEIQALRDGEQSTSPIHTRGSMFGELSLLASVANPVSLRALTASRLARLDETAFWQMMTICPEVRRVILGNMAQRFQKLQSMTIQQEKMASLGTMAAGLMHELNNPGTAVKRAASQLREGFLTTLHLGASVRRSGLSAEEDACLRELEEYVVSHGPASPVSPLELSDAEDALCQWMEHAGVREGWKIAPTLAGVGVTAEHLQCARKEFSTDRFRDSLAWVESVTSCLRLVSVIEEGIGRVADLVGAVKSYAYEGRGQKRDVDVNKSVEATLLILGHKMREKGVHLTKELEPALPAVASSTSGLNQVWTNLLDNAIDAVNPGGHISVATWSERSVGEPAMVCLRITDDGSGISQECQAHVFDPFYTTKEVGVGTGLGLSIAYRVVEQVGGTVRFASEPGRTEFIVRLPVLMS